MKTPLHLQDLKTALEAKPRQGGTDLNESDYKRRLVAEINRSGGRARRIEDKWSPGVLDMIIRMPGREAFWAEGKVITANTFRPTPIQYEEGMKWIEVGMNAILIGWQHGIMYISPWAKEVDRRDCFSAVGVDYVKTLTEFLR